MKVKLSIIIILLCLISIVSFSVNANSYTWVRSEDYCSNGVCKGNLAVLGNFSVHGDVINFTYVQINATNITADYITSNYLKINTLAPGSVIFLDNKKQFSDSVNFTYNESMLTVGTIPKGFTIGDSDSRFHLYGTDTTDYGIVDTGINFPVVDKPPYPTVAVIGAGNVNAGKHYWQVEYYTEWGGTGVNYFGGSPSLTLADASTVRVTIPVSTDYRVIGRRIYRTKAGGSSYKEYLLVDIPNNVDTFYDDSIPDSDFGGRAYAYLIPNKCVPMFLVNDKVSALIASGATVFGFDAKTAGGGVSFGSNAGKNMADTAFNNALFGNDAGYDLTTGSSNVLIGANAGEEIKTGSGNVVIGGQCNDAGGTAMSANVLIGKYAGRYVAGNYNIALGANALSGSAMGNSARNIGLGYNALYKLNNVGDGYNIGIGWYAGNTITTGKSNIMIGANVQPTAVTASSEINIGNTIYGNIATGSVGIGTSLPSHEFNVLGSANITDDVYVGENFVVEGNFSAKRAYLTVSSNESQEVVIASTAYVMNFSHIEDFFMMGLEGSENITVEDSGDYVLALSGLFVTDSNNKHFNIWVQTTHADGITFANVPRSNTRIEVENAGTDGLIAVTYMLDLNSGDKFRLMYSSDDAGSMLLWTDGSGVGVNAIPETPSMIMTVFKHSEITT